MEARAEVVKTARERRPGSPASRSAEKKEGRPRRAQGGRAAARACTLSGPSPVATLGALAARSPSAPRGALVSSAPCAGRPAIPARPESLSAPLAACRVHGCTSPSPGARGRVAMLGVVVTLTAARSGGRVRIAQVSPLHESVPPKLYGGTERVVSFLTEELVASGTTSRCSPAATRGPAPSWSPCAPRALRLDGAAPIRWPTTCACWRRCTRARGEFDVIHFHIDYLHFPFARRCDVPHVTTLHGRLDIPDLAPLFRASPTCRWSRSPTRSARRCRSPTGAAPCTTGCRPTCSRSTRGRAATWRSWGGSRPRSGSTARSRSRGGWACR